MVMRTMMRMKRMRRRRTNMMITIFPTIVDGAAVYYKVGLLNWTPYDSCSFDHVTNNYYSYYY
jgi:hypothetical protein